MLANLIKAYAAASGISGAQLDSIIAAAADGLGFTLNFRPQICRVSQLQAQDGRQLVYAVSALGQYPQAELAAKAQEAAARINQLGLLCAQPLLTLMARDNLLSVCALTEIAELDEDRFYNFIESLRLACLRAAGQEVSPVPKFRGAKPLTALSELRAFCEQNSLQPDEFGLLPGGQAPVLVRLNPYLKQVQLISVLIPKAEDDAILAALCLNLKCAGDPLLELCAGALRLISPVSLGQELQAKLQQHTAQAAELKRQFTAQQQLQQSMLDCQRGQYLLV